MTRRLTVCIGAAVLCGCAGRNDAPATPTRSRAVQRWVLSAGTNVPLRTVVRIEPASPPQSFGAVVVGEVLDNSGEFLVGSGAPARLIAGPQGLALAAVMIYGTWHAVSGDDGGPASLGTLVRGVIETPPPGAALKESMAIRTSGPDVQVPAGSLLIFRLDAPARVGGPTENAVSPAGPSHSR